MIPTSRILAVLWVYTLVAILFSLKTTGKVPTSSISLLYKLENECGHAPSPFRSKMPSDLGTLQALEGTFHATNVSVTSSAMTDRFGRSTTARKCMHEIFDVGHKNHPVLDLSCIKPFRTAFYHRMVDCLLPSFCALTYAQTLGSVQIIVPSYLREAYQYFVGDAYATHSYHTEKPHFCLSTGGAQKYITMIQPNWAMTAAQQAVCLSHLDGVLERRVVDDVTSGGAAGLITLIQRNCSRPRCFKDPGKILARFTSALGLSGRTYFGNESFEETVRLFRASKVVVGFHGAGFANTIFCRPGTVVLEYTTFHDMDATEMWRTNEAIAEVHSSLRWIKHTLDVDRIVDLAKLENVTDMDHYIKGRRYIEVTGSELYNSIERVRRDLE